MITITDQQYYDEVRKFAEEQGILDDLEKQIKYLHHSPDIQRLTIGKDFAPHSFTFSLEVKVGQGKGGYRLLFNGGIIYSGPGVPSDGSFPSLSVNIGKPKHGWSIHT